MKTYIVPVIHHVAFGCEVAVRARDVEQAKLLALQSDAEVVADGYEWDRMTFERAELGNWGAIRCEEEVTA